MFWKGQFNAILALVFFAGVGISAFTGVWEWAISLGLFVVLVKLLTGVLNMLFKAFLGFPLVYDVKTVAAEGKDGKQEARTS